MKQSRSGFTIVELLIVIVVIAILAAISVVAYSGIQQRGRMSARASDIASIQKALEIYRVDNGTYPATTATTSTNLPAGFAGSYGSVTSYAYSVSNNSTWLKALTDLKTISKAPTDPVNDNTNFYMYYANNTASWTNCPVPFYVLVLESKDADSIKGSRGVYCPGAAYFSTTANRAVFSNISPPLP